MWAPQCSSDCFFGGFSILFYFIFWWVFFLVAGVRSMLAGVWDGRCTMNARCLSSGYLGQSNTALCFLRPSARLKHSNAETISLKFLKGEVPDWYRSNKARCACWWCCTWPPAWGIWLAGSLLLSASCCLLKSPFLSLLQMSAFSPAVHFAAPGVGASCISAPAHSRESLPRFQ